MGNSYNDFLAALLFFSAKFLAFYAKSLPRFVPLADIRVAWTGTLSLVFLIEFWLVLGLNFRGYV